MDDRVGENGVARRDEHRFEELPHESRVAIPGEFIGHGPLGGRGITLADPATVHKYQPAHGVGLQLAGLQDHAAPHAVANEDRRRQLQLRQGSS